MDGYPRSWGPEHIAVVRITTSSPVSRGPTLLYGFIVHQASGAAASLQVRDGENVSAQLVFGFTPAFDNSGSFADGDVPVMLPAPILLRRGLFIQLAGTGATAALFFMPVREEQLVARAEAPVEGAAE